MIQPLYRGESPFGKYKVVDMTYNDRPARMLFGDQSSPQSGVATDDNPELLFDYNQRFMELIMSVQPKRLLVIGGGAFTLPTAVFYHSPRLQVDVVEIDELLVQLGHEYFGLPEDPRLRVFVDDGAAFLQAHRGRYDMIIVDAFSGLAIPQQLLDDTALMLYKKHLTRGGVVAVNVISEYTSKRYRLAHQLVDGFERYFKSVELFQADPEYEAGVDQNYLLVAGAKAPDVSYLQSEVVPRVFVGR